jgi:CRP-like cAMP-binding protein
MVAKLDRQTPLGAEDRAALLALPYQMADVDSATYLVRDGDRVDNCCVLLHGFAFRSRTTQDGGRQILAIHMDGDAVDLQNSMMHVADHSVQTLTNAMIAYVPRQAILDTVAKHPKVGEALWRQTLIEASIAHEWILNIGRRNARQRVSHFLCEVAYLQKTSGLVDGPDYAWPFTQEQMADVTGLTAVHVNRILQGLRGDGLIKLTKHLLTVLDWDALRGAGNFRAAYLHQDRLIA